jgi:hypothetical protein
MRTTITLADDNRNTLYSLAQARGDKGLSRIVEEAVAFYLAERNKPAPVVVPAVLEPPSPPLGPWQRLGAEIDRTTGADPGFLSLMRALVRNGLGRLRVLRA